MAANGAIVGSPLVIGVAGGSGSGKTTISARILEYVGADRIVYLEHDAYYSDLSHLPLEERKRQNFDHPNALDDELFLHQLKQLVAGQAVDQPIYDFAHHTRSLETRRVEPRPVVLIEGILIFTNPELRRMMDIKVFVDTDADIRFIRRLTRDVHERERTVESVISQYVATVRPMHLEFVEPSKRHADVIVPSGGNNTVALGMICSRIEALLVEKETDGQVKR